MRQIHFLMSVLFQLSLMLFAACCVMRSGLIVPGVWWLFAAWFFGALALATSGTDKGGE